MSATSRRSRCSSAARATTPSTGASAPAATTAEDKWLCAGTACDLVWVVPPSVFATRSVQRVAFSQSFCSSRGRWDRSLPAGEPGVADPGGCFVHQPTVGGRVLTFGFIFFSRSIVQPHPNPPGPGGAGTGWWGEGGRGHPSPPLAAGQATSRLQFQGFHPLQAS